MTTKQHHSGLAALTLGAIGVVYGDIGTSPLYTVSEIFGPAGVPLDAEHIIGAVSSIFWALMLVVTLKYVILILRADNRGEGGALALTALATQAVRRRRPRLRLPLLLLGVFGATLFYGDSIITPAISVMGAIEGLEVVAPHLQTYVLPISVAILIVLFLIQRYGTEAVGKLFGPVIVVWFLVLAVAGVHQIAHAPQILAALNPFNALSFLINRGWHVFVTVGAIVLALTGAEALYADMGHFGAKPIRIAWLGLVMPALALNYLGQGALLISNPKAIDNPFYRMFPDALLLPMVALAALASLIASQAVISGAYSMTKQAILLGFLPRMTLRYTSAKESGQIYVPAVNWVLLAGVLGAVLLFRSSAAMASAYGIAVTMTMLITTVLTYFVVRDGWKLPKWMILPATAFFLSVDLLLVAGCAIKFMDGGWMPLAMGLMLFIIMTTWSRGRRRLMLNIHNEGLELQPFIEALSVGESAYRAARTAIYPVANVDRVPPAMLHNLKHNQVLHECNVILTVVTDERPYVPEDERVQLEGLAPGFWRVHLFFGFMERPDVPAALALCEAKGLRIPPFETSYFLSRETVVPAPGIGVSAWRDRVFAAMTRNAGGVAEFYRLPDNAVVELGTRVQI